LAEGKVDSLPAEQGLGATPEFYLILPFPELLAYPPTGIFF
jgi:hypothetical protein